MGTACLRVGKSARADPAKSPIGESRNEMKCLRKKEDGKIGPENELLEEMR